MHLKNPKPTDLHSIAQEFGTPIYLYDIDAIVNRYRDICTAFSDRYQSVHVALSYKTCPLLGILNALHQEGAAPEVVSEFEFDMAEILQTEQSSQIKRILNGPHKTDNILSRAIKRNDMVNVDHEDELYRIQKIAKDLKQVAKVGIRLSLGEHWNRFGFPLSERLWSWLKDIQAELSHVNICGIHVHIGTAIRDPNVFHQAAVALAAGLQDWPFSKPIEWLDLGGGLAGISAKWEDQVSEYALPDLDSYAQAWLAPLSAILSEHQPELIIEPGRTLFEPFGSILSKIITCRERTSDTQSLIIDCGINALPTARVYRHPLYASKKTSQQDKGTILSDLYGPLCLQADTLAKNYPLPQLETGDLVLIQGVGAYNQSRSVPFIQPRPGVVGIRNNTFSWLRHPETLESHLGLERWPLTEPL